MLRPTASTLVWLLTAVPALVLVATLLGFTYHPYLAAAQALPVPLALTALAAALLAALLRAPHAARAAIVVALTWSALLADAVLASRWAATNEPATFAVAAANLRYDNHLPNQTIISALTEIGVDVLVTSETPTPARAALRTELPEGWREAHTGAGELGAMVSIWTHLPVIQRTEWVIAGDRLPVVMLETDQGPVIIVGTHLNSPVTRTDLAHWRAQLTALAEMVCAQTVPVVIAGDLNATITHPAIRPLTNCAADAAASQGVLWARTWSSELAPAHPLLGLDHVLVANARVSSYDEFPIPGSDHEGVVAGIVPSSHHTT
jgi:endonuclease/exonuclease/phosphatase (EEP) superfamily protein YafD